MEKIRVNTIEEYEWNQKYNNYDFAKNRDIDINNLYERAHSEMSLQQSKRDQIINIYLAICTFIIPFSLGKELDDITTGLLFIGVSVIGCLFSFIALRYRIYKEIYWMCCQTLTVLQNFNQAHIDKACVQSIFYNCIKKRGNKYIVENKNTKRKLSFKKYVSVNMFSAETLYFFIIVLITSAVNGVGVYMFAKSFVSKDISLVMGVGCIFIITLWLLIKYFSKNIVTYKILECEGKEADEQFKKIFDKAWFLHIYYDL